MNTTTKTPVRRLPVRAAKVNKGKSSPANPTPPRPGGRVTRSTNPEALPITPSASGSASKRAASPSPLLIAPAKRSRRPRPQSGHYEESSDDDDDDQSDAQSSQASATNSDDEPLVSPLPSRTTRRARKASTRTTRSRGLTKHTPTNGKLKSKLVASISKRSKRAVSVPPQNGAEHPVIPRWEQLPFYVLLNIFECAAGTPLTSTAAKWLLDASLICRAFMEPALTALYRRPPLLTLQMAHGLAKLLSKPPSETTLNYRQKVEELEIDVRVIASKTFRGQHLDFKALFNNAPRLTEVYVWHEKDQAPYRELDKNIKWTYPADMFRALGIDLQPGPRESSYSLVPYGEATSTIPKLRTWMWSSRMLSGFPLKQLRELHTHRAFSGLRKLTLTNFQLPSLNSKDPEDPVIVEADSSLVQSLTQSISVLSDLRHLVLECSTAATGQFLSLLPKGLEHLELINCWEITADHMAEYLLSHGSGLRHLTLHHNQSLSLAFLPVLRDACPQLETLRMDLTYFKLHAYYSDSGPAYDTLLTADQVPTWPATLRHLDFKNLRQWDEPAAETFFQSLLDSAPDLPKLRHIEIKAMLDIPFRERSRLRDKWNAKIKQVFLRKWVDPLPRFTLRPPLGTLPPGALPQPPRVTRHKKDKRDRAETPSPRRSGRIATLPSGPSSRASSVGRDMRDQGARPFYAEPDSDEDMTEEDDDDAQLEQSEPSRRSSIAADDSTFVQGLCDVVDIRFDNQKPVENQFSFEDFLDEESNDPTDDDWDQDEESDHDYAW